MTVLTMPTAGAKQQDKEPLVRSPQNMTPRDRYSVGRRPERLTAAERKRQSFVFTVRVVVYVLLLTVLGVTTVLFVRHMKACELAARSRSNFPVLYNRLATAAYGDAFEPPSDADALSALMPSDADALSALMPSAAVKYADDDLYKRYEGLARFLGSRPPAAAARRPSAAATSARFIHDFSANVTCVVDAEGHRCFVMPLVRDAIAPPSSLYDLLFKMSSGYYSVDMHKVMSGMRVVRPAVRDLSPYGVYIAKDCGKYNTFKLEKGHDFNAVPAIMVTAAAPHAADSSTAAAPAPSGRSDD